MLIIVIRLVYRYGARAARIIVIATYSAETSLMLVAVAAA